MNEPAPRRSSGKIPTLGGARHRRAECHCRFIAHAGAWSDWRTGLALNFFDYWLLIRFAVLRGDKLLGRFILFGLVVGLAELPADVWLGDYTRTLDYSIGGGPMLWCSPLWMPLAWEIVTVQFSYLGLRLWQRFGRVGLGIIALLGAINIPFYEEMAKRIHCGNTTAAVCFPLPRTTLSLVNSVSRWCSHF